jgi:hypothetical protein
MLNLILPNQKQPDLSFIWKMLGQVQVIIVVPFVPVAIVFFLKIRLAQSLHKKQLCPSIVG